MNTLNVTRLIDERPIGSFQLRIFFLCAAVVFLDGIDYQVIGIAAPLIRKDLHIATSNLTWLFAAGTFGGAIGAFIAGLIADRIGRKITLIATTLLFGFASFATASANDMTALLVLRFVTGLGLGGAVPCFIALTSEYTPQRRRATVVAIVWAAFPLGGMCGGFINSVLLHHYDWRHLFWIWGTAPVLLALALAALLPESVRFLLTRAVSGARVRDTVGRIQDFLPEANTAFIATDERLPGLPLKHLFARGRVAGTLCLWAVLLISLGALSVVSMWTPALITAHGFTPADAALIVAYNGLGSFIGSSSAGRLIERLGVARSVVPAVAMAGLAVYFFGNAGTGGFGELAPASFLVGLGLGVVSSSGIALSALVYPTAIRSTGIGWAIGIGRLGSMLGPLAIGLLVAMALSVSQIFLALALCVLCVLPCALLLAYYGHRRQFAADL